MKTDIPIIYDKDSIEYFEQIKSTPTDKINDIINYFTEFIKNGIVYVMDKCLLTFPSFQNYVNERFNRNQFVEIDGFKWKFTHNMLSIFCSKEEYDLSKIRPDDVVLSIGANIGGVVIPLSKRVKQIYAIEPLFTDILLDNIYENKIDNILVLKTALGIGIKDLRYNERRETIKCQTLSKIIKKFSTNLNKITVLQIDCEGGEWCIRPEELNGIRLIEAEVHVFDINKRNDFYKFLDMLKSVGFTCEYAIRTDTTNKIIPATMILHAERK